MLAKEAGVTFSFHKQQQQWFYLQLLVESRDVQVISVARDGITKSGWQRKIPDCAASKPGLFELLNLL